MYNYSNTATYAAYLTSWGPHYYSGRPLGPYYHSSVLPKLPGPKKYETALGEKACRPKITKDQLYEDKFTTETYLDPKEFTKVPNIMLMDIKAPEVTPQKLTTTPAKPAASPGTQAPIDSTKSSSKSTTTPVAKAPTSPPPAPTKRKRTTTDSEEETPDEIMARQLQFELNYGSRKRVRHSRGGERFREL